MLRAQDKTEPAPATPAPASAPAQVDDDTKAQPPSSPAVEAEESPEPKTATAEPATPKAGDTAEVKAATPATDDKAPSVKKADKPAKKSKASRRTSYASNEEPAIFSSLTVKQGDKRHESVSVFGNSTIEGDIESDAVAVFGNNTISGSVAHDGVAVFGNLANSGTIGHDAVAVFGNLKLDGSVKHDVVVVFGRLDLGPNADVGGNTTVVFGQINRNEGARIGNIQQIGNIPGMSHFGGVGNYVNQCLLRGRLLGFGDGLGFAWAIALAHLLFYVVVALILRKATDRCVTTLKERPGMSILTAFLAFLITPLVIILLAITGIGAILLPFLILGLFAFGLFGRVVMLAGFGGLFTRFLGESPFNHAAFAVLLGGLLVCLLYCVPVVAWLVYSILGSLGLGVVLFTLILLMKRDRKSAPPAAPAANAPVNPAAPAPAATLHVMPPISTFSASPAVEAAPIDITPIAPVSPAGFAAEPPPADALPPQPAAPGTAPAPAAAPSFASFQAEPKAAPAAAPAQTILSALPRANFWTRLWALLIDIVLVIVVAECIKSVTPDFISRHINSGLGGFFLLMATYGTLMWKYRGTTIGGTILKLQVVRTDDRPLDWATCIVRGLGTILSAFFIGLGFIWIRFDPKSESWHDKIAGTAVVSLPSTKPLV
jgi:uncharacterized RDD family membrane protein YckC/cytoskeletal protein CcmA (bactofilin family)